MTSLGKLGFQTSSSSTEDENLNMDTNNLNQTAPKEKEAEQEEDENTLKSMSLFTSYYDEWIKLFEKKLSRKQLMRFAMEGSLRSSRFRSVCWKIFLEVLPDKSEEWLDKTRMWREKYEELKNKFVVNPRRTEAKDLSLNNPLSQEVESPWNQFFQDNELRLTIKQDVIRTFPDIPFFHLPFTQHAMNNILFIFAKHNTSLLYLQGMHELLAPLIFVLHSDHQAFLHASEVDSLNFFSKTKRKYFLGVDLLREVMNPEFMEHDAFSMFCQVMETAEPWYVSKEIIPVVISKTLSTQPFSKPPDQLPSNVIINKLTRIQGYLLKRFDPDLHDHLIRMDIAPQIYGIRWIRLLFGREFPMQDLLMLWDAIFADSFSFDLVDYIFLAMLMYLRKAMLTSDYPSCLYLLMRFPPVPDISYFISKALWLREPKDYPHVPDQFYQKPHNYGDNGWEINKDAIHKSRRPLDSLSTSSAPSFKFSKFISGKRPGSLLVGSSLAKSSTTANDGGLMSKSTSEPMNLITDTALSPVQETKQVSSLKRKGSSASLPAPEFISTPLLPNHLSTHGSNASLYSRMDSTASSKLDQSGDCNPINFNNNILNTLLNNTISNNLTNNSSESPQHSLPSSSVSKFFMFGNRASRKNKQMKTGLGSGGAGGDQEITKSVAMVSELEAMCRKCAYELDVHIGTLQRHLLRGDGEPPNSSTILPSSLFDDDVFLALAGMKQVRDMLKGSLKPSFASESPDHVLYYSNSCYDNSSCSSSSLATTLAAAKRKQQQAASQTSLAATPLQEKSLSKTQNSPPGKVTPPTFAPFLSSPDHFQDFSSLVHKFQKSKASSLFTLPILKPINSSDPLNSAPINSGQSNTASNSTSSAFYLCDVELGEVIKYPPNLSQPSSQTSSSSSQNQPFPSTQNIPDKQLNSNQFQHKQVSSPLPKPQLKQQPQQLKSPPPLPKQPPQGYKCLPQQQQIYNKVVSSPTKQIQLKNNIINNDKVDSAENSINNFQHTNPTSTKGATKSSNIRRLSFTSQPNTPLKTSSQVVYNNINKNDKAEISNSPKVFYKKVVDVTINNNLDPSSPTNTTNIITNNDHNVENNHNTDNSINTDNNNILIANTSINTTHNTVSNTNTYNNTNNKQNIDNSEIKRRESSPMNRITDMLKNLTKFT